MATLAERIEQFLLIENADVPLHMYKNTIEGWKDELMGSGLLSVDYVLDDTQVRNLHTTPVEIIPAPDDGLTIVLVRATVGPLVGTPYTVGSSTWQLDSGNDVLSPEVALDNTLNNTNGWIQDVQPYDNAVFLRTDLSESLFILGNGAITGGAPGNLVPISVAYWLAKTST